MLKEGDDAALVDPVAAAGLTLPANKAGVGTGVIVCSRLLAEPGTSCLRESLLFELVGVAMLKVGSGTGGDRDPALGWPACCVGWVLFSVPVHAGAGGGVGS